MRIPISLALLMFGSIALARVDEKIVLPLRHCELALNGATVALEIHEPVTADETTYLMLPGLKRALHSPDEAVKKLAANGKGVVSMNFSTQPFSLAFSPEGSTEPATPVTMESLKGEVERVRGFLNERGLRNIVPVSLSFGGAVSAGLTGFDTIIDIVPMTSADAQSPTMQSYRSMLEAAEWLNPLFGRQHTRNMLDQAYRTAWGNLIDQRNGDFEFGFPAARRGRMLDGGVQLSRAVEKFDWENIAVDKSIRRIFILAGNEARPLFQHQKKTAARLMKQGYNIRLYIVDEGDHFMFRQQPQTLAQLLLDYKQSHNIYPSLVTIKPSTGERSELTGEAAVRALD